MTLPEHAAATPRETTRGAAAARAPIRVAFGIDNMNIGGTELNAVRLAERLDRSRFELRVVCLQEDGPLVARYEAAGIPIDRFPISSLYGVSTVRQGLRLARHLRRQGVEVFHAHDRYSNLFSAPWARLAGAKVIASRRWWEGFPSVAWRVASRTGYRIAHVVIANSPAVADLVRRQEGVAARRIHVLPNFLDESAFEPPAPKALAELCEELGLEVDGPTVGIVANLRPIKDHASLLRAISRLREEFPGVRLVLVGDGECHAELSALAQDLGIAGHVVFAGRRVNRPNLHHLFRVSVLCSLSEGSPNSILEAMAAGRPVVATRVGGIPDAVVDGGTGLLVPPRDPAALADAIATLLRDRGRAAKMGSAARERARAEYSAERAVDSLERLYIGLAARREGLAGDAVTAQHSA